MTTITRERLLKIQQWRETYGPGSNVVLPAEEAEELARIALASLTAEPVAWMVRDIDTGEKVIRPDRSYFEGSCQPLYTAPPVPVTIDERAAFNAWNNEDNLPIAGVGAKNAAWLAWQARAKLGSPTAPVVPDEMTPQQASRSYGGEVRGYRDGWNACRAAVLNGGKS